MSWWRQVPGFRSRTGWKMALGGGVYGLAGIWALASLSHSGGVQGACSHHGGERRPLYAG